MATPSHKFVSHILPTHKGYPKGRWWHNAWGTAYNAPNIEEGVPPISIPQQCLQYGINPNRVTITHAANATTASLVWENGSHDFTVGDYVNLRAFGGGSNTADGYYKILTVPDNTHVTIEVPAATVFSTFTSPATEDLSYSYLTFLLDGNSGILVEQVSLSRNTPIADSQNQGSVDYSTAVQKYGTTSYDFNGSGKRLCFVARTILANVCDFTLDAWVYPVSGTSGLRTIAGWTNTYSGASVVGLVYDAGTGLVGWQTGGSVVASAGTALPLNAWSHVAVVRSNGVYTLFVNGVKFTSAYQQSWNILYHLISIGGDYGANTNFPGYIQSVRLYKGCVKWDSAFDPATEAYYPRLRYGVGYFATRGGGIIRPATHIAACPAGGRAINDYGNTIISLFQLQAYYDILGGTAPIFSMAAYGSGAHRHCYVYALNPGDFSSPAWEGGFSFGSNAANASTECPNPKFAYVFSNAGFYQYVRTESTNPATRAGCMYFGKAAQHIPLAFTGNAEALASCVNFSYGSFEVGANHGSQQIRSDNLSDNGTSNYSSGGLLATPFFDKSLGASTAVNTSTGGGRVRMIIPQLPNQWMAVAGAGALVMAGVNASPRLDNPTYDTVISYLASLGIPLGRAISAFSGSIIVSPPGSVWELAGRPVAGILFPYALPSRTKVRMYGEDRDAIHVPSYNTQGFISLNLADWETR